MSVTMPNKDAGHEPETFVEAALKAEEAKKRQDEVEAERKAEAEAAKKKEEVVAAPVIEAPEPAAEDEEAVTWVTWTAAAIRK